jgi:hypothetical protein
MIKQDVLHLLFRLTVFGLVACAVSLANALTLGTHVHDIGAGAALPPPHFQLIRLWDARVVWPNVQPGPDEWRFERLDAAIGLATEEGREVLLPLGLSPQWSSSRPEEASAYALGNAATPKDIATWQKYVERIARRYSGRVQHYEIWNEPNKARFFSGDVDDMVNLTCAAYQVLKQIDPRIVVVSPAATGQLDGIAWLKKFLLRGGAKCVDVVAFHFYTLAHEPPEAALPLIQAARNVMVTAGVEKKPLWDTEFGWLIANAREPVQAKWRIVDATTAGAYLARALILRAGEHIDRAYFYAWNNRNMGAIEPDTKEEKSFADVFKVTMAWLKDVDLSPCVRLGSIWRCDASRRGQGIGEITWANDQLGQRDLDARVKRSGSQARAMSKDLDGRSKAGYPIFFVY